LSKPRHWLSYCNGCYFKIEFNDKSLYLYDVERKRYMHNIYFCYFKIAIRTTYENLAFDVQVIAIKVKNVLSFS